MSVASEIVLPSSQDDLRLAQAHRLNDGAMALREAGKPTAVCLSVAKRALALAPGAPFVISNIGLLLWDLGDIAGARAAFEQVIAIDPSNFTYHRNLGVFATSIHDTATAEKHLNEAIRLSDGAPGAKWDLSVHHLAIGRWDEGLEEYDIRRAHRGPSLYPGMPYPLWQGENLNGKSIYIQGEQGTGDRILFSRYIAWLKGRYQRTKIYVHMRDDLVNLMWDFETSGIVERFMPTGVAWPKGIDYGTHLQTIPRYHKSQRDTFVPPDPGLIKKRTIDQGGMLRWPEPEFPSLKVGICWTGNPHQTTNPFRTIPLEMLIELAEDPRIQLYSVQVGPGNIDLDRTGSRNIIVDLAADIEKEGWLGTAQVLIKFDVVITACTSIAHLAGALDCNVWTLLCKEPYWVWPRTGSTTGWYPSMRLFRQREHGGWRPVIEEVKGELGRLADARIGPA